MEQKKNWFLHPRSFIGLLIIGFGLVSIPLIVTLFTGAFYVEKLTKQSQEAVLRAVQSTQNSQILQEQVINMERNIRKYLVLQDPIYWRGYLDRHVAYVETSEALNKQLLNNELKNRLLVLNKLERELFERLADSYPHASEGSNKAKVYGEEFIALTELAQVILNDTSQLIDSEMKVMQDLSEEAQTIIYWELMAVLPGAIIIIIIFIYLLSRPIRQLDAAIKRLGEGEFDQEISVSGPKDIQYLGKRLDWLRRRLQYLEDKKVKFLHYVSHELKTPLTSIRESAELMSEEILGPLTTHQKEVTGILRKSSISLQTMIEKLLSFNTTGKDSLSSGMASLFMKNLVDNIIADHKAVLIAKKVNLNVSCDDIILHADEEQVRVIIDNLLSNAIKYAPYNGKINLKLAQVPGQVLIDITDNGPGILEAEKDKVFEAFYRGSNSGKGLIKGSGLGLSIVREFVEAHEGKLELITQNEQAGAHFRVTIPQRNSDEELAWAV